MKHKMIRNMLAGVMGAALLLSGCGQKQESAEETKAAETQITQEADTQAQTTQEADTQAQTTQEADTQAQEADTQAQETDTQAQTAQEADTQTQTSEAPDFEAKLISGETVKLSDYQGKKVLLNFWATWCGPCVGEMPALQKLSEEYPDELAVLAVNSGEDEKTVKQFTDKNGYTFPIAVDTDLKIGSLYPGVMQGIPYTVIIDEKGNVMDESIGASDADTMYEHYKEMLGLK